MVTYIKQEHPEGCGIACLAMVLNRSYEAIIKTWKSPIEDRALALNEHGLYSTELIDYLNVIEGVPTILRRMFYSGEKLSPWPPVPFAPVHIVAVRVPKDGYSNGKSHFVVMDDVGKIYDPVFGEGIQWNRYVGADCDQMIGVFPK